MHFGTPPRDAFAPSCRMLLPLWLLVSGVQAVRVSDGSAQNPYPSEAFHEVADASNLPSFLQLLDDRLAAAPAPASLLESPGAEVARIPLRLARMLEGASTLKGAGSHGKIFAANARCPGACWSCSGGLRSIPVVLKMQKHDTSEGPWPAVREAGLMRSVFTKPSFPKFFDNECPPDADEHWLMMEAAKGDLKQYKGAPLAMKMRLVAEAMFGVAEMHRIGYIHRDIKPGNIFIVDSKKDGREHAIIGDFGLTMKRSDMDDTRIVGSPGFLAPEILTEREYSAKQDIWAMALSIYELLFDDFPELLREFPSAREFVAKVKRFEIADDHRIKSLGNWLREQDLAPGTDVERLATTMQNLFVDMMIRDPQKRISSEGALKDAEDISRLLGNLENVEEDVLNRTPDEFCPGLWAQSSLASE